MSSKQSNPNSGGFGQFVPGFEFLQNLAKGGNAAMASWVAPTLDPKALDKRIEELKAVQFWLDQNAAALKATIQALEVQKMTLATLQSMNVNMPSQASGWPFSAQPAAASAPPAAEPAPKARPGDEGKPGATPMQDPMQYWSALTRQFQQIASDAMQDVARRAAEAPKAAKEGASSSTSAKKPAARRRAAPRKAQ